MIIDSSLITNEEKEGIFTNFKLSLNEDIKKRIKSSVVESIRNAQAVENEKDNLKTLNENHKDLIKQQRNNLEKGKELQNLKKNCDKCRLYCVDHDRQNKELIEKHDNCPYCGDKINQNKLLKEEGEKLEKTIIEEGNKKIVNKRLIQKLLKELSNKKDEQKILRREVFAIQAKCPVLNKSKSERKNCQNCQKQMDKKHIIRLRNALKHTFVLRGNNLEFEADRYFEIYLLSKENVC
jgi:hypothetical protein